MEQLHKIFKLCGSPSEEYWKKSKLPHATIFKPQQPYKRCLLETFKDFPSSALALLDVLLAVEPERRGTASSALRNEVGPKFFLFSFLDVMYGFSSLACLLFNILYFVCADFLIVIAILDNLANFFEDIK